MQNVQPSLFTREDTFFGVCQGLGEDLGIHPNILRLALALSLFFNPVATFGAYAAAGLIVLLSRTLFPNPRAAAGAPVEAPEPVETDAGDRDQLPLAA